MSKKKKKKKGYDKNLNKNGKKKNKKSKFEWIKKNWITLYRLAKAILKLILFIKGSF